MNQQPICELADLAAAVPDGAKHAALQAGQKGLPFIPLQVPFTSAPEPEILALIRGRIRGEMAETYPRFASTFAN